MHSQSVASNYYALLGIPINADSSQIKKAYYAKIKVAHPDKSAKSAQEAGDDFIRLQTAYQVLIDPLKRRNYDESQNINQQKATNSSPSDGLKSNLHSFFSSSFFKDFQKDSMPPSKSSSNDLKREIKISQPVAPKDSYYALLGISTDATFKTIQDSYMDKLIKLQKSGDSKSQNLLNQAYQTLTDDAARKKYDESIGTVQRKPWGMQEPAAIITYSKMDFQASIVCDLGRLKRSGLNAHQDEITNLNMESKNLLIQAIAKQAPLDEIKNILKTLPTNLKNERDLTQFQNTPAHLAVIVDRDDSKEGDLLVLLKEGGCDLSLTTLEGDTLSHLVFYLLKNELFDILNELHVAQNDWEFLNLKHLKSYEHNDLNGVVSVSHIKHA